MIEFVQTQARKIVEGVTKPALTNPYTWGVGAAALAVALWILF